jgi:hypothetical protein
MTSPSPARDAAYAALAAQAARTARRAIKDCARAYARAPQYLDAIVSGLSMVSPRRAVECLELLHRPPAWRFFGFGGEHPALNVRGALLYARYARAKARHNARRAAA